MRVAAARDDELKQALKAMERRLEMRKFECVVAAPCSQVELKCAFCRPKFGLAGVKG